MKLAELFVRKRIAQRRGQPPQFEAALKGKRGEILVTAQGATQEEADAALLEMIRGRFRGISTPLSLQFRGSTLLLWRDGDTWVYGPLYDRPFPTGMTIGSWTSRDTVEKVARRHLAEIGWDEQEEVSPIILSREDQQQFADWARKEKRHRWLYRELFKKGWLDQEAHHILCGFLDQLDPARLEALGDPRSLLTEASSRFPTS